VLVITAIDLAGCGVVSVERTRARWVCTNRPARDHGPCLHRFDAERLVGLTLEGANRLAGRYGYEVRSVAPLGEDEFLTADYKTDRLDVEASRISEDSIVVAFKEQG
jgi:hypothetical protein